MGVIKKMGVSGTIRCLSILWTLFSGVPETYAQTNPGPAQNGKGIRIGLITDHVDRAELLAMEKGLKEKSLGFTLISLKDLNKAADLEKFTHLWYHRTDTVALEANETRVGDLIRDYVRRGGNVFLSMESVPLLNDWKIESHPVQFRQDTIKDEGFGRPLGFHAFRSHPLFDGLQGGGAYTSKQRTDHIVRQHGFFGDTQPQEGKVIGIQWTYITFGEQNKLLLEYTIGKGKIIAAGSYLYYGADNYNKEHLAKFTENVFRYAADQIKGIKKYYWKKEPGQMVPTVFATPALPVIPAEKWILPAPTLLLSAKKGSTDFYDLVGRRILWMGKMDGGLDEIWVHPFMALKNLSIGVYLKGEDTVRWLKGSSHNSPEVLVTPEYLVRTWHIRQSLVREIYTVSFGEPCGVAHIETEGQDIRALTVQYASNLRFMWPYSPGATGTIRYGFNKGINGHIISGQNNELNTTVLYSKVPVAQTCTGSPESGQVNVRADFSVSGKDAFNMYILGSTEGWQETLRLYSRNQKQMGRLFEKSNQYYTDLLKDHLHFETPDSSFNEGYKWALARTDQFLQTTPGVGTALMAGFGTTERGWNGGQSVSGRPGYAWYFGRDGEWSALAIDAYGDFNMVKGMLETLIRYQDINGKIYHELTSSGTAHYDASDATPLFIILAGHYLKYSGDLAFIRQHWDAIQKALDFCYSTDTDHDGLIENTNVGHGWIEGGRLYGSHTEFYLAACWGAALQAAAYMTGHLGLKEKTEEYTAGAASVKQIINDHFWNEREQFFYNGKMKDGSFMPDATVLASVAVYLDAVTDRAKSEKVSTRLAANAFSTDWGIRMVEETNPKYKAGSYHAGMVWPLYAGWAALSEFRTGNNKSGYQHIINNLQSYRDWSPGSIEETFNGDRYTPNGVCSHQCWSEAMVLLPAIEGLLGLETDALAHELKLAPYFPWDWKNCTVKNIRIGQDRAALQMKRESARTQFDMESTGRLRLKFRPAFPLDTRFGRITLNGREVPIKARQSAEELALEMDLDILPGKNSVVIEHSGGIGALPVIAHPIPGQASSGLKILSEAIEGKEPQIYTLTAEGTGNKEYEIKVFHAGKINKVENGELVSDTEGIAIFRINLHKVEGEKYTRQQIKVFFE